MKRLVIVGAGRMATVRTKAFLETQQVRLCGVASRNLDNAYAFAGRFNCEIAFDDYQRLADLNPDIVLVETPHQIQTHIVHWAITSGYHTLIGGCPACSLEEIDWIRQVATKKNLIVEAGYEARYKAVWKQARQIIQSDRIGQLVAIRTVALFPANPESWYYNQAISAGMPLTHMTYAFINPLRWLLGDPLYISAFANRKKCLTSQSVVEETCIANLLFPDDVLCSMTAGYVRPGSPREDDSWYVAITGINGELKVFPSDEGQGRLVLEQGESIHQEHFEGAPNAFELQVKTVLDAIDGDNHCHNTPQTCFMDVAVAEVISQSVQQKQTIELSRWLQSGLHV